MKSGSRVLLLLSSAALFCGGGCATTALWDKANYYEPASQPNLRLSVVPARRDVLVEYDEYSERTERVRRRAYFLDANTRRVSKQHKPKFVNPTRYRQLEPIPFEPFPGVSNQLYATVNRDEFALHGKGDVSSHFLPVYFDSVTRTKQVLLTPPAVIADVTLVSAVVGFFLWAQSGFVPLTEY